MNRKSLPAELTSYDLVKFAALALMIVDHIGAFFYPEEMWFRAIGRMSAPIWLFFIGYAKSRDFSAPMWIGMVVLGLSAFLFGGSVLPVNILGTMLVCRFALDPLMNAIRRAPSLLYPISVMLFFATIVTFPFLEYGSVAMLIVMLGYMTRNRDTLPFDRDQYLQYAVIVAFGYFLIQSYLFFAFDFALKIFAGLGLLGVMLGLSFFQPRYFPEATRKTPKALVWLIQIGGRYSLEFYVVHLIIFKAIAAYLGMDIYGFFDFHILK
jgi:hypothetical protein